MHVRETDSQDWLTIRALMEEARFASPALWPWEEQLGRPGFVVVEMADRIEGALCASADESPVAWVRLAAVGDALDVHRWLDVSLPPVLSHLRTRAIRKLVWMDRDGWAGPSLEASGFQPLTEVVTLKKTDRALPHVDEVPVTLRPAAEADFEAMASIDRKAFTPTWWRSANTLRRQADTASRFAVAERPGRVVGYAERVCRPPTAHLNRLAVDPAHQGQGIGAFLLSRVLVCLWDQGAETISLNTQRSNHRSRRLYEQFGFHATGDGATVWELSL